MRSSRSCSHRSVRSFRSRHKTERTGRESGEIRSLAGEVTGCVPVKGDRTTSGFFCAQFLKSEKKISKRVLAKSVDLNLYARDFGPLFRSFFGKAALFCPRQSVEFRPAFLLVLPNAHSKHRCRCVSPLCGISDVKTAGKPHPTPGRKHGVLAMLGREKAKHPLPAQRVVVYLLALSRASVFNVTPIMSLWASRVSRQSGDKKVSAF